MTSMRRGVSELSTILSALPRIGSDTVVSSSTTRAGPARRMRERRAPAVMLQHPATPEEAEQQADVQSRRIERERAGAFLGRIEIGDHRVDRRPGSASPMPVQNRVPTRLPDRRRIARQNGHDAEHGERHGDDIAAAPAVGEHGKGDRERGVDHGEYGAREQSRLEIVEDEFLLDVGQQDAEDLAVEIIDDVHERENDKHIIPVARAEARSWSCVRHARPFLGVSSGSDARPKAGISKAGPRCPSPFDRLRVRGGSTAKRSSPTPSAHAARPCGPSLRYPRW